MSATPGSAPVAGQQQRSNNEDDDSFSSDSEDEFLTTMRGSSAASSTTDREAMIRKKLLESFYGKSAVDTGVPASKRGASSGNDTDSRDTSSSEEEDDDNVQESSLLDPLRAEDLDSPQFNAAAHTQKHVLSSGVHPLLETEESLACQVRTLDSTLQTLVYENYSRFIEATDAIRSIGVNVQANQANLSKLQQSMTVVGDASRSVEQAVGPLRDQVVEKLRVKRLLQRLDTLLKLPTTLRQQIRAGKYRLATQSYVSAYGILSKHSRGFESLQRIETDCHGIMTQLLKDVRQKLVHWSGGVVPSSLLLVQSNDSSELEGGQEEKTNVQDDDEEDFGPLPDPPQSIVEIMECAGTFALILNQRQQEQAEEDAQEGNSNANVSLDPQLTLEDCQSMALSASLRFLERILDTHHIELQGQQLVSKSGTTRASRAVGGSFQDPTATALGDDGANASNTLSLVPTSVLDSILEVATLFTMNFLNGNDEETDLDGSATGTTTKKPLINGDERLSHFISTAFGNFLQHVRGELLEQAMLQQQHASRARAAAQKAQKTSKSKKHKKSRSEDAAEGEEILRLAAAEEKAEAESDQYDEHIANAMGTLLLSARQLASGLTLVSKGVVSPELASSLVDQTTGLTEAMVRRRVDQKFYTLRLWVVEDCLAPFCQSVIAMSNADEETKEEQPPALLGAVQLASVALSDSLQLVDDTVRSILANLEDEVGGGSLDDETADDSMLREAVEQSTYRFAKWLASAMEMLAGYESSTDPKTMLEAKVVRSQDVGAEDDGGRSAYGDTSPKKGTGANKSSANSSSDDMSEMSNGGAASVDNLVENALLELVGATHNPTLDMVLAIAEMCRVAERSVMDNIRQSIATHGGGGVASSGAAGSGGTKSRKMAAGTMGDDLFMGDETQKNSRTAKNPISRRFRLAASRVLSLYAMSRGHEAGVLLCLTLPELAHNHGPGTTTREGPRPVVCQVLELVKATSLDCSDLFGGNRRAGPIPDRLQDEYASLTSSRMNTSTSNRSGLVFDVERMFAEKVIVYPHPSDISDFQRNAVVALIFKVAFKAWAENARLLRFSVHGYRQIKVDVEFLKWFLPHYVKDETLPDGSNARTSLLSLLTEVVQTARERCVIEGEGLYQDVDETNDARATIRVFMSGLGGSPNFCITED